MAALVHYLASSAASFTTGRCYGVGGAGRLIDFSAVRSLRTSGHFLSPPRSEPTDARRPFSAACPERAMDESPSPRPSSRRHGQGRDNDVLVPRAEADAEDSADVGNPSRAAGSNPVARPAPMTALFTPPVSALGPLFRHRFERIYECRIDYELDVNKRATVRVLGGYYKSRRLIRVYARDREHGLRPIEELFDTFLHEMAHHLEYTEPFSFSARSCGACPAECTAGSFGRSWGS